jgi:hypothetical protein
MSNAMKCGWPGFLMLASIVAATMAPAAAQDKIVVRAGDDSAVVARTSQAITNEKATLGSVAKMAQGAGTAATNVLLYLPPVGASEIEDTVQYTVDGKTVTVPIAVKATAPTLTDSEFYAKSFKALFALFILAVLVENGLALIFRWRPFLDYFDSRTVNALVAFAFSLVFVWLFKLDIATTLVNTYAGTGHSVNWPGMLLTASIIGGGSGGVNRMFQALGFRAVSSQQQPPAPKPPRTEAWIAVTLVRKEAVGPVTVLIDEPGGNRTVAGTISGVGRGPSWWRYVVRDKGRFPTTGGHTVALGKPYEVVLQGMDRAGNPKESMKWGPYEFAPGALVDLELSV